MKKNVLKIKGINCRVDQGSVEVSCYGYKCNNCCGLKNCDCENKLDKVGQKKYAESDY